MFKKFLIPLYIFSFSVLVYADSWEMMNESINKLSQRVDILEYKLPLWFEEKLNSQSDSILTKITSISSQWMSQQQNLLAIFAVLFTIIAVLLWAYISWISKKIEITLNMVKAVEESAKKTKSEIELTLEWKTDELYLRIQDAETKDIFQRLEKYPEEISNSFALLATRNINSSYFEFLKGKALMPTEFNGKYDYILLLFQHFYERFLNDERLIKVIKENDNIFSSILSGLFLEEKNDMFKDIATQYIDNDSNENYLWFLRKMKWSVDINILNRVWENFQTKDKNNLWKTIITD